MTKQTEKVETTAKASTKNTMPRKSKKEDRQKDKKGHKYGLGCDAGM